MSESRTQNATWAGDTIGARPLVFLRAKEVCERLGIKKTKLYSLMSEGDFPIPAKLGKASVWPEHEVEAYMEKMMGDRYRPTVVAR